jgi:cell wall-associated NlpC family hydrolase
MLVMAATAAGAAALLLPIGVSEAATPSGGLAIPGPTTTTTLPALPTVDPSITEGQPAARLLANAIALSSLGTDSSALLAALSLTQAKLDADAAAAREAQAEAAAADARAEQAQADADAARRQYAAMLGAVKGAVVFLYTNGPGSLAVDPRAGVTALFAQDYADAAISPYGVLMTRKETQAERKAALRAAAAARRLADSDEAKAAEALAGQQSQAARLRAELSAIDGASSAEVAADHLTLASEAATELVSATSLQFTPKTPLPAPVATTSVALSWAFSELGKPYLWGGTGPNSFDCSGLTQFVWRAAGVSIPRVAADQDAWAVPVPLSQLLPGDLVFFGTTDIHHVGIYIGDGLMINAPHTGDVVRVSSIWWSDLAGFGRVHTGTIPVPPHETPSPTKPAAPAVKPNAGLVPSQPKPPPGWKPSPGSSAPIALPGAIPDPEATTSTTTTSVPAETTTTSLPSGPTTTTTSATLPGTDSTSTTATTISRVTGTSGS